MELQNPPHIDINKDDKREQIHQVKFHGDIGEYFKIWIVNILLTLATFGIYSAWATVRRRRYFLGNTEIDGSRFDYHAKASRILIGRIIAAILLIAYVMASTISPTLQVLLLVIIFLFVPYLIVRSWRFNLIMTSFRNIRFNYKCRYLQAYWVILLFPILGFLGLYLVASLFGGVFLFITGGISRGNVSNLLTFAGIITISFCLGSIIVSAAVTKMLSLLAINNASYGKTEFKTELKYGTFVKIHFISTLIFIPFIILFIAFIFKFIFMIAEYGYVNDPLAAINIFSSFIYIYFIIIFGVFISSTYRQVAERNYILANSMLGDKIKFRSTMKLISYLGLLLTNLLIVVVTLGLGSPVAHIRHSKYLADHTQVIGDLSLVDVFAHPDSTSNAVQDEIVQAFDLGITL